ncbi:Hypothetical protein I595_1493 [Croceitalea dokdonensis DOKDO 023]|uniref:Uncharacterized protein n=1 Tax=Croceitalea dokdonensis DOKDO 023 TaxID=1300341 RepID=A0A0P7AMD5_9FLAO|nr:Hypothetical protein I595_1493 [Croceitalea dokdonensis DOKDO 023]
MEEEEAKSKNVHFIDKVLVFKHKEGGHSPPSSPNLTMNLTYLCYGSPNVWQSWCRQLQF